MQIENKIALDVTIPDKTKDSIKAKKRITIQAYSAFAFKYNSIFSNIILDRDYIEYFTLIISFAYSMFNKNHYLKNDRKI